MGTQWINVAFWNAKDSTWIFKMSDGRWLHITPEALATLPFQPFGQLFIHYWLRTTDYQVFH